MGNESVPASQRDSPFHEIENFFVDDGAVNLDVVDEAFVCRHNLVAHLAHVLGRNWEMEAFRIALHAFLGFEY